MTKDDFFRPSQSTQDVPLDNGNAVKIRKLTAGEVDTMRRKYLAADKEMDGLCFAVVRCVVDDSGARIFTDADAAKLAETDFDLIKTISTAVLSFSGLSDPKQKPAA